MIDDFKLFVEKNELGTIIENESMIHHTYVQTGGRVKILYCPKSIECLALAYKYIKENNINYYVIGRGSNLLFTDEATNMVVIKISNVIEHLNVQNEVAVVGAGYPLQKLTRKISKMGLSGLEFAGGIPGAVGGAVFMNAGAHTSDIGNVIKSVKAITSSGEIKIYSNEQCEFGYRHSVFQRNDDIIIETVLEFEMKDSASVFKRMSGNLEYRKEMQPLDKPSFGSIFRNPPGQHAGQLIEAVGLKGCKVGGAKISEKHANFIINDDLATTNDMIELITLIQKKVKDEMGFDLETEVKIVK